MNSSGKTIILKGTFQSFLKNVYGIFIMFFKDNNIENSMIVAGTNSSLTECKLTRKWTDIEDFLLSKIESNETDVSLSQKLKDGIHNRLKEEKEENRNKIIFLIKNNERKKLTTVFTHLFETHIKDRNISFIFNVEEKTHEEIEKDKEEKRIKINELQKIEEEKNKKIKFNLPMDAELINSFLVLAPVNGILISELKPNDLIMIKLDDSIHRGKYIADFLKAYDNGVLKPVPAKIHFIDKNDLGEYTLVGKLDKNIFCFIEETEEVKVKPFEQKVKKEIKKQETNIHTPQHKVKKKKKKIDNSIIIITVLLLFLALLIYLFLEYGN